MSSASDTTRSRREGSASPLLALDPIACTGHGICASLLPGQVTLDEWGYPVIHSRHVDPALGDAAIRLCPSRALSWTQRHR